MDYGAVLSRAWQIIWKYKVLWIFGILAACSGGSGGGGSTNFRSGMPSAGQPNRLPPGLERFFQNIPQWQIALIVGMVILVILVLVVIAIFLGTVGRIGLIRGTLQAEQGATSLSFGELFNGSLPFFWRVFALNLIVGLAIALIILVIVVPVAIIMAISLIGIPCLIPLICLLVPAAWLVQIILTQANIAIVVENLGIMDGLQRGWELVKNNLGPVIVMGLILILGLGLIGGFIIGLPLLLVLGPIFVGLMAGTQVARQSGLLIGALCLVAYLPVLIVLNGILRGYIETAWTLTFMRLTARPAPVAAPSIPAQSL